MTKHEYNGYLLPYVDDIIKLNRQGLRPTEIAHKLKPIFRLEYGTAYYAMGDTVRYILKRLGEPLSPGPRHLHDRDALVLARHRQGTSLRKLASEFATSKDNIRRIILKAEKAEKSRLRRQRLERSIAQLACRTEKLLARQNLGRPIDMGGPRDVDIDYEPWER